MKAMVLPRFGAPDVLEMRELEIPPPGPNEVRVRVVVSGTNPVDAKVRAAGSWAGIPLPAVIGYDVSGTIESVGPGVEGFRAGDEVWFTPEIFGNRWGSYAEMCLAPASIVGRKPKSLTHEEAAAVPLAGGTAYEAIVRRLKVQVGQTVLIHGGAGGVGSFAVQIAKAAGARVLATASGENVAFLRELGADVAIDYKKGDIASAVAGETIDAVFDTVGSNVAASTMFLKAFGRIATILPPQGDLTMLYVKNQTLFGVFLTRERARLDELARLVEQGKLKPQVEKVLPLAQVAEAHRRLDSGHGRGKVVLRVGA